jgi:hypothetical protein
VLSVFDNRSLAQKQLKIASKKDGASGSKNASGWGFSQNSNAEPDVPHASPKPSESVATQPTTIKAFLFTMVAA